MAARRRRRLRQRLPRRAAHATRLAVLGPVRHQHHDRGARLASNACTSSSPTSMPRATSWPPRRRRLRGVPPRRARRPVRSRRSARAAGRHQTARATARSRRSTTRTATRGCCRRSRRGCRAGWTHDTSYASSNDLGSAMRRASVAHGEHEPRTGEDDTEWPDWYATYMVAEFAGTELPDVSGYDVIVIGWPRRRGTRRAARRRRPPRRHRRAQPVAGEGYDACIVEDPPAARRGGRAARRARRRPGRVHGATDVEQALAWRDFMVRLDDAGQEAAGSTTRHRPPRGSGRLAGVGGRGRRRPAHRRHVVLANGSEPFVPPVPACASSKASGRTARRPA